MMENRSFDHMLGWLPGANGRQQGLIYADETGAALRATADDHGVLLACHGSSLTAMGWFGSLPS